MISSTLSTHPYLVAFWVQELEEIFVSGCEESHWAVMVSVGLHCACGVLWLKKRQFRSTWLASEILWTDGKTLLSGAEVQKPSLLPRQRLISPRGTERSGFWQGRCCTALPKGWFKIAENWHWALFCFCSFKRIQASDTSEVYKSTRAHKEILPLIPR